MKRDRKLVVGLAVASLVGLTALAGCSSTKPTASTSESTAPSPVETTQASSTGFGDLQAVVTKTKTAVEAGDFAQAKTEFDKFESAWQPVEDGVKAKSPDSYDKIETNMDQVTAGLKAAQPDKTKVLASLQALDETITNAAK